MLFSKIIKMHATGVGNGGVIIILNVPKWVCLEKVWKQLIGMQEISFHKRQFLIHFAKINNVFNKFHCRSNPV